MKDDLDIARLISSGDEAACESFVEEYSGMVLSRMWTLMKSHCDRPAREAVCTLLVLQRMMKGPASVPLDQCDECMDSYVWFFEFLKKKAGAYKGSNNCSFKTFVWSVANSHSTYVEWLRWRYGRAY